MDNFVIWKPERDGHAPPLWESGMKWCVDEDFPSLYRAGSFPFWTEGCKYCVPAEAVNGQPVKVDFDYATWRGVGLANPDKLPDGVVLPEPTDWAMELVISWMRDCGNGMEALAKHIRTHCRPGQPNPQVTALVEACRTVVASSMRNEAYDQCVKALNAWEQSNG